MRNMAVDWTAVGSVATGGAMIAAFLAIVATIAVYYFQSRRDRAAAIRQNLQFIHGQQVQVLWLLNLGLEAVICRQIREFKERLGSHVKSAYFIHQLFDNHALFCASAADSNLSSDAYSKMSSVWDQVNAKAFEFRGALHIFSYARCTTTGAGPPWTPGPAGSALPDPPLLCRPPRCPGPSDGLARSWLRRCRGW
jgi:hypothetical protein